jgi:diaminobutyrate-2-oxoglutarate transaminase
VIELAGAEDNVVKFLPSLTMDESVLREGLDIIESAIGKVAAEFAKPSAQAGEGNHAP